jgi:uncharacterized cupin superfamily protein
VARTFSVFGEEWDERREREGWRWSRLGLARRLEAEQIGASLYELEPGQKTWPYHFHHGQEEMVVVVSGTPTLRDPAGERQLEPGDVVLFKRGPEGAHLLRNDTENPIRLLMLSSLPEVDVAVFPDSDKIVALSAPPGKPPEERFYIAVPQKARVDYFEGEE